MHGLSPAGSMSKRQLDEAADENSQGLLGSQGYSIKRPRSATLLGVPSPARTASPSQDAETEAEICYGMLVNIAIQFNGLQLKSSLTFDETGHGEDTYVRFQLVMSEDRCDIQSNGVTVASLNKKTHLALKSLSAKPLKFIGLFSKHKMDTEVAVSAKTNASAASKRMTTMSILIIGPRSTADAVAQDLSRRRLFLQHPHAMANELPYENPQYLTMVGSSFTNGSILPPLPLELLKSSSCHTANDEDDDAAADLVTVMENLPNYGYSPDAQIDGRVKTPLLKHQKEAVSFVTQREAAGTQKPQSLWRIKHDTENKSLFYQHMITGAKSVAPDDVPGGILADGMGLGKTLTMIASITASLSRAEESAQTLSKGPAKAGLSLVPVQSTLIIVPSTLLMDGWVDEINKHVVPGAISIYKYHGPNRKLSTAQGLPYHIVFSTYGTVSADFYSGGGVLNEFHWYRLILDEAHAIRNSSTKQFKALTSISASIRWCMTGTVIQNSLDDLASLVRFLRLPTLDDSRSFRRHVSGKFKMIQGLPRPDYANLKLLLRSMCFGRNTSSILSDLDVSFVERRPRLSIEERKTYDKLALACDASIKAAVNNPSGKQAASRALTAVLRLRVFCNTGEVSQIDSDDDLQPDELLSLLEQDGQSICPNCRLPLLETEHSGQGTSAAHHQNCQCYGEQAVRRDSGDSLSTEGQTSLPIRTLHAQNAESPVDWTPTPSAYPSKMKALLEDVKEHYLGSKW
jgi:SWI/SNF-related matrix-associated actin-dependent regulator of chromatin subfamily A3